MIEFILKSQNYPFTVSLTIMLFIAVIEGVTTLLGMGLSSAIDSLLPDLDMDADLDVDSPEITDTGVFTKTLGWLRIGEVPFLIILIAFLTVFGLTGLFIQTTIFKISGSVFPGLIATIIALPVTLPIVRVFTGIISRIMPKDETEAVTEKSFIGLIATISLGKASAGKPAQAKLRDKFGTTHYIMIEPDLEGTEFRQGDQVLIVKQTGTGFKAIENDHSVLQDDN